MAHCININTPEYKQLVKDTKLGQRELKARIATWQDINNDYDNFPTAEEVVGLLDSQVPNIPQETSFDRDSFISEHFPTLNAEDIKEATNIIINNNVADKVSYIQNNTKILESVPPGSEDHLNAFSYMMWAVTSVEERKEIYERYHNYPSDYNFFEMLSQRYDDHIINPVRKGNDTIARVFKRIKGLERAFSLNAPMIMEYIRKSQIPKGMAEELYAQDRRVYDSLGRGKGVWVPLRDIAREQSKMQKMLPRQEIRVGRFVKDGKRRVYPIAPRMTDYPAQVSESTFTPEQLEVLQDRKQEFFGESNTSSAREILEKLSKKSELAKVLLDTLPVDIPVVVENIPHVTTSDGKQALGYYSPNSNMITLGLSGITASTMVHEIMHGMSLNYMKSNPNSETVKDFISLFEYAKTLPELQGEYGLTNEYEFMSELFSNTRFQKKLSNARPKKGVKPYKNLFKQIWDTISKFFGISKPSLFEQSFSVASNIINEAKDWYPNTLALDNLDTNVNYAKIVNDFEGVNSPNTHTGNTVSDALRRLNSVYTPGEINELADTIVGVFGDVIDYYQEEHTDLSREDVIRKVTPIKIFQDVREELEANMQEFSSREGLDYYVNNQRKMLDNYNDLVLMALPVITENEGLMFGVQDYQTFELKMESELDSGISQDADMSDNDLMHEEMSTDGWWTNSQFQSVGSSMSRKVKRYIKSLLDYTGDFNEAGEPLVNINSVGFARNLDPGVATNEILKAMQNVRSPKDLLPEMEKLAEKFPWANAIIEALQEDNEFHSQFYTNFKKAHTQHWVVKTKVNNDGSVSYETISINTSDDTNPWIDSWKGHLEKNIILNKHSSVYNSDGTVNKEVATNNKKILEGLERDWRDIIRNGNMQDRRVFIESKLGVISNQLKGIGVSLDNSDIKSMLNDATIENDRKSFNLNTLLRRLIYLNDWVAKGKAENSFSIIENNSGNYNIIAKLLVESIEDSIEGAVTQNGKTYWTYLKPSFITNLMDNLKNPSEEFIENEYRQYDGTLYNSEDGTYNIHWLNNLLVGETTSKHRDALEHKITLALDRGDYSDLSDAQYQQMLLAEYFGQENTAWYHVPILAEAPIARFIKGEKITVNYRDNISRILAETVFMQEYNRIQIVRSRKQGIEDGTILPIKNFDSRGGQFQMLSFLNEHMQEIDRLHESNDPALLDYVSNIINQSLNEKAQNAISRLERQGLLDKTDNGKFVFLSNFNFGESKINPNNYVDALTEYYYNSYLASANIIQLTTTDLAFYNGIEDFQKRNKQVNAPGEVLNTEAMYNGERIGKDNETYIVLADQEVASTNAVKTFIEEALSVNNVLTPEEKSRILSLYERNNLTDAQAFRSLDSAKSVIAMHKGWNDILERAYQNLKSGQFSMDDYNTIFQAFKPFAYSQNARDSGVLVNPEQLDGDTIKIKVPTQHKNSEIILLPHYPKQFNSPKLQGLLEAMNEGGIDVVMFESAVKVGLQGHLNINDMNSPSQIKEHILSFKDNSEVFKTIPYTDYKIQQPVNDSLQDSDGIFGTQGRALIMEDVLDTYDFTVNDTKFSGEQLKQLYNNTIIENLLESFQDVLKSFDTIDNVQNILQEEILSNTRYSRDLIHALTVEDGKFTIPLYDPSQANRIEQLINSIWKSRITKQKIKGGKVVNMSSFGVHDNLELKYSRDSEGKVHIEYMEVYMPFWSEKVPENLQGFIDPDTGIMDVQEMLDAGIIDEAFLQGIGYRIPTEDKYSMWPIKVKGFLHRSGGGNIVMPREITTIVGLDFDIDSLYLMMKEFDFKTNYDWKQAWADFYLENPSMERAEDNYQTRKKIIDSIEGDTSSLQIEQDEFLSNLKDAFKQWFQRDKHHYITSQKFETIQPDMSKDPKDMNRKQRNNLLIDIYTSVLQNPNIAEHSLNPGNFDLLKATSRRMNLLASGKETDWSKLENMSLQELQALDSDSEVDILDFTDQVALFKKNMVAARMIGIVANHSVNHAIRQHTQIEVAPVRIELDSGETLNLPRFKINGKFHRSLHSSLAPDGKSYISKAFASTVAASVDAVKDPVLDGMNYNTYTADTAMLLTALGYDSNEIGLFLRQPIIEEVVRHHERHGGAKNNSVKEILSKYENILRDNGVDVKELKTPEFLNTSLAHMIHTGAMLNNSSPEVKSNFVRNNPKRISDYTIYQYQVLKNFDSMMQTSQVLADLVGAMRAYTGNGGAGPTIADNKMKLRKVSKHQKNLSKGILSNADILQTPNLSLLNDIEASREFFRESPIGYAQAYTTLGWQGPELVFSRYFPHYKDYFDNIFDILSERQPTGEINLSLMKKVYGDFLTYYMSQFDNFNIDSADKYINEFPNEYQKILSKHPELQQLSLIKNIHYVAPTLEVPVAKLRFRAGGRLSNTQRDKMIREWESLLYQPKYGNLAFDLFYYNYFVNGFSFGTTSFMHMTPTMVKKLAPGFVDNMNKLMDINIIKSNQILPTGVLSTEQISSLSMDRVNELEVNNDKITWTSTQGVEYFNSGSTLYRVETLPTESETHTKLRLTPMYQGSYFSQEHIDTFIDQLYRNNLGNRYLVPEWSSKSGVKDSDIVSGATITINPVTNPDVFIDEYTVYPYIMVKTSEGDTYFKTEIIFDQPYDNGVPIRLQQVQPLGIRNQFLTYSFNNVTVETPITDQFESLDTDLPDHISDNDYRNSTQNPADYDYWNSPNENHDLTEPDWIREQREAVALSESSDRQRLEEFGDIQDVSIETAGEIVSETSVFGQESNNIEILTSNYTRQSVQNDVNSLYLFTDNAQRTSRPTATEENVDKNSWYYKKYKSQTDKPIHFGSTSNPTSAVIRGLNNAYPISTMSAYGTNWTNSNFDLFKQTIDDEIAQIKKDLPKFSKVKIGNFRIGQGGRFAKLPQQHQEYLDNKLLEIGIDNTGNKPKIINSQSVGEIVSETSLFGSNVLTEQVGRDKINEYKNKCK